ncbi:MAG: hypothetical protein CL681_18935 [Blastopirellula sp.]|nr:hypothetical protein [Blastopirellula sp.]
MMLLMARQAPSSDPPVPLRSVLRESLGKVTRREVLGLSLIMLVACFLRVASPQGLAVEHFDEGVYASNIWSPAEQGGAYPLRHYYAPPLVPFLIEISILLTGTQIGPLLPNLVIGSLTVGLVWVVARSWCGPTVACSAAILAASSDIHILYSRTGLTDILLSSAILLAVWLASVAIAYRRIDMALLAGLTTSLAWWTKYNGWLPIPIACGGVAIWLWRESTARNTSKQTLIILAVLTITAVLGWLPFLWSLQSYPGGYASVSANHAGYLVGFPGWYTSLTQQLQTLRAIDSWIGIAGAMTAVGLAIRPSCLRAFHRGTLWMCGISVLLGAIVFCGGQGALLAAGTAFFCVGILRGWNSEAVACESSSEKQRRCQQVGGCLLTIWLIGLSLTIPLYTPYPRLTVAWFLPAWIATAATLKLLSQAVIAGSCGDRRRTRMAVLATGLLLLTTGFAVWQTGQSSTPRTPVAWESRAGTRQVAVAMLEEIEQKVARDVPTLIYVCGEPALYYHLNALISGQNRPIACVPSAQLAFDRSPPPDVATFVAVGPFVLNTPADAARFDHPNLSFVTKHTSRASTLMVANLAPPNQWESRRQPLYQLFQWQQR